MHDAPSQDSYRTNDSIDLCDVFIDNRRCTSALLHSQISRSTYSQSFSSLLQATGGDVPVERPAAHYSKDIFLGSSCSVTPHPLSKTSPYVTNDYLYIQIGNFLH